MTVLAGKYKVALKRLSAVETARDRSNQHELNGSSALRDLLGSEERRGFTTRWVFLRDEREASIEEHKCSWYDARERHPDRTEWRLYFDGDPPMAEGDLLVCIHRELTDELLFLLAAVGSTWQAQLELLFGQVPGAAGHFTVGTFENIPDSFRRIAEDLFDVLGWSEEVVEPEANDYEKLRSQFGDSFPTTRDFSQFARTLANVDLSDPDAALLAWWRREEQLFRAFEDSALSQRLRADRPFASVDDFVSYSLSVQNRRKSRAGKALENHVEELLTRRRLRYTRGARTEGDRRPDFLLPGILEYGKPDFPDGLLTMLAVKTTCKDRWRQILTEAERIDRKHLLTLEPAISTSQLAEMRDAKVQLVVVKAFHSTYAPPPGMTLMTIGEFVDEAMEKQSRIPG